MTIVPLKELTIDHIKDSVRQKAAFCIRNEGGELFQHPEGESGIPENCLLLDIQSTNVLGLIYDALNPKNQARFNSVLQDEYKFANLLDKMWGMVTRA
jgi:hypothetical protein